MADYYPLLARALDALPDRTPALRKAVYDRARNALISQLRSLDPPLSENDIDLERRALDAAIERLEVDHGGLPAPANDAALTAGLEPVSDPVVPEPAPPKPAAAEPALPAANPPFERRYEPPVIAPEPDASPREAPIAIAPRRPGTAQPAASESTEPADAAPPTADDFDAAVAADTCNGRQRPRIEVVPPRAGRSRLLRNVFVGGILAAVIAMIAVAAFLLRDRPQSLPSGGTETADMQQPESETKFGDRVGGDASPTPRTAPRPDSASPPRAAAPSTESTVSVAQRAELIEEVGSGENAQPTLMSGRVTWKLDTVNGDQGQPLQNAVVASVTIPDAGLTLVMTLQRNLDATLPASHTVNLTFSQTGGGGGRTIQDVGLLQAKDEQNARGSPVSGLPVRVRDNLFLIGLSSLPNDIERNTDLLLHKNWFDLALRYTSGKRAVLTFEKGATGTQVMQNAFAAWQ
ncbi:histidine kinase [Methylobacterium sp. E-005]|uniref:histidine kinase n=1 Tax=Methylobacterium sp. E-005 TaxID=2836549 RepID=UPI001FBB215B|nr:histidine kinase [Methylobacterium sp. E-005]MCJ2086460.1 histidine kinase [Methylobacterium sp. E-005]